MNSHKNLTNRKTMSGKMNDLILVEEIRRRVKVD